MTDLQFNSAFSENLVKEIQNYGVLNALEIERIQTSLHYNTLAKSHFLFQSGSKCATIYFILNGCFQLYQKDFNGNKRIKQFAFDGCWITDFKAFHQRSITNFELQALENSTYLALDYETYESLTREIPVFSNYFRKVYQEFFILCQELFFATIQNDGKGRYLYLTEKYPTLLQRVPLYMLASFLGVTPVLISNIRKQIFKEPKS
ncbi:Crp/Fnr family transcriptional regulator [Sphingobacterium sp.]|uniref:Crp/Fnr family transcriptional regulator n=1 Tax=Sphingobacterium sp. TaxID=341027 RepID=UPI002587D317|nr:Crp/Fnr family transcriptional regulator [Sphingobacterium sp.]WET68605.1 MAG: Crp/Fnr family transcriptional regulator [Sphingobacterium sp.]